MQKILSITILMLAVLLSFGQMLYPTNFTVESKATKKVRTMPNIKSAAPFWTEDFSGGIPTTWENINTPWVYRGPGTSPGVNTGSQGAYAGTNGPISSPTAANGFMIFDSDYYDNGGTQGAFGTGIYPCNGINGAPPIGHVGTLTTDVIDCSMYSDISMFFNSFYREYTGIAKIAFSIDGGITFTDTLEAHPDIDVNERTENDYQVMVRMPFNIAGNTNVKIQFIYDGTILYNTNYNGYYFWMIDDIELMETPSHLIKLSDETFGGWVLSSPTTTGDMGIPYTFNPIVQATANPYRVEGRIINQGSANQSNTQLNVNVRDDINVSVFSDNSTAIMLNVLDTITVGTINTFAPTNIGKYSFDIWASSDSTFSDTATRTSVVTDSIYGRDYDWDSDGANAGSGYYLGRHACGQVLANAFEIYAPDTVTSISFFVDDQSVVNSFLKVELHEYDPAAGGALSPIWLEESDDYTLTSADIGAWVTLKLNSPVPVFPGTGNTAYLAAVAGYSHPIDTTLIGSSGSDGVVSFVQDNGCNIGNGTPPFGYWYSLPRTLMIRMNLGTFWNSPTSIEESTFNGSVSIYPNPTNGIFTIEMNDVEKDIYTIKITNVLGQKVFTNSQSVNGIYKENIDLSTFQKGVYLIEIKNSSSTITERVVVE